MSNQLTKVDLGETAKGPEMQLVDASQSISDGTMTIPPLPPVKMEWLLRMEHGAGLDVSLVTAPTHAGTHVDAPSHAIPGAATIDEVPLDRFIRPASIVEVHTDSDGEITGDQLHVACGKEIQPGDGLIIATGFGKLFGTEKYLDHPALGLSAVDWILDRGVSIIGVDLITVDAAVRRRPEGFAYPIHRGLLGNDVLIIENLSDLRQHAGRCRLHALPLNYAGRDGAPARVVLEV